VDSGFWKLGLFCIKRSELAGKLGDIGGLGPDGFLARRDCNFGLGAIAIVCCDCDHRLDPRFWVLRKRAPFYNRADYPVLVDFFGGSLAQLLRYAASAHARRTICTPPPGARPQALYLNQIPRSKEDVGIDQGLLIIFPTRVRRF